MELHCPQELLERVSGAIAQANAPEGGGVPTMERPPLLKQANKNFLKQELLKK